MRFLYAFACAWLCTGPAAAHVVSQTKGDFEDKFRQLDEVLPTPNGYRTGSGAPGHEYWQQRADYRISVELDDEKQRLSGEAVITYTNNSPDRLNYIWLQLDQNRFRPDSRDALTETSDADSKDGITYEALRRFLARQKFQGGYVIGHVRDGSGRDLPYTVNGTLMRIDLPAPLLPRASTKIALDWAYNIVEHSVVRARGGYEYYKKDGNYLYSIAQWYPRLVVYSDAAGWHNKEFLGRGEFTLEFGDYEVAITVPADHVVAATGELQNPAEVLSAAQRSRLDQARRAEKPVFIVTRKEAEENEKHKATEKKTWRFRARNVRDFAFASSRKFIWDAWGYRQRVPQGEDAPDSVMAMSFYPKEGEPLWSRYSTHAVVHTMEVYSRYSFAYPYPVAQSVNSWERGGMEYPMITFNGRRPEINEDKGGGPAEITWSRNAKYGLVSVIIHEIGHIYFPMTVNSDERQWTWMDEGLNSFLQFLAEQEWEEDYPSARGDPRKIVDYMKGDRQVPIMTQSDSILQFGNNAYGKPATALSILRETVMGRELFDHAFREYARRWRFKRPMPADFFRTMEDASGIDLDWFWRGWFYTTDHVDIALTGVAHYRIDTKDPEKEEPWKRAQRDEEPGPMFRQRNKGMQRRVDRFPELKDFYNENDEFTVSPKQRKEYGELLDELEDWEKEVLKARGEFYVLDFENRGGLVMPLILALEYEDGSREELRIPAEIWRRSPRRVSKMLVRAKKLAAVTVDPHWETADTDVYNNSWPRKVRKSRLDVFKDDPDRNLMKEMLEKEEVEDGKDAENEAKGAADKPARRNGDAQ